MSDESPDFIPYEPAQEEQKQPPTRVLTYPPDAKSTFVGPKETPAQKAELGPMPHTDYKTLDRPGPGGPIGNRPNEPTQGFMPPPYVSSAVPGSGVPGGGMQPPAAPIQSGPQSVQAQTQTQSAEQPVPITSIPPMPSTSVSQEPTGIAPPSSPPAETEEKPTPSIPFSAPAAQEKEETKPVADNPVQTSIKSRKSAEKKEQPVITLSDTMGISEPKEAQRIMTLPTPPPLSGPYSVPGGIAPQQDPATLLALLQEEERKKRLASRRR